MRRLAPWAGWIGGLLGWLISDQVGTTLAQADCSKADLPVMLLIGVVGAAIALAGAAISFLIWRAGGALDQPGEGTRRFVAVTGMLASVIFLCAIIFQTMSSLIIPQCHV